MCRFNIKFEGSSSSIADVIADMFGQAGDDFSATSTRTSFSVHTPVGRVDGVCTLAEPDTIGVIITKKPFFVPCSVVRDRMVAALVKASKAGTAPAQSEG